MMKTYKLSFTAIVLLLILGLLSSCSEDFLNKEPLDEVVSTNFYKTEKDAQEALIAVYDALGYQSTPGISWAPYMSVSDILSDDSYAGGADANDGQDEDEINTFNIPTTNAIIHSIWLKNYTGIYRANLLMEKLPEMEVSQEVNDRMVGECKFMRAHFYLELVRSFENIPLLTETLKGPSEYSQEQNDPREVYDQIALDLVDAIASLPASIDSGQKGRLTKWSATGLLARTYLFYNGVYGGDLSAGGTTIDRATVLAYVEDMINNSDHDLLEDYSQVFRQAGEFGPESVFEIAHGDSPAWWDWGYVRGGEGNLSAQWQGPRVTGSTNWNRGWSFAPVSEKLASDMRNDPRFASTILTEGEIDGSLIKGYQHTGYFSKKYSSDAEHQGTDGQLEHNRTCNNRVIRYSDVLLMAAELGSPNAQAYLDRVRARVGLPSVPVTMESIYQERRLELALEGIRYFDVLRRGQDYATTELTSTGVRGANYEGDQVVYEVNYNSATRGFLPIPQTEMDLSAGVFIQNEGY